MMLGSSFNMKSAVQLQQPLKCAVRMHSLTPAVRLQPALQSARVRGARGMLGALARGSRALASAPAGQGETDSPETVSTQHFRLSPHAHPLNAKPERLTKAAYETSEGDVSNKMGRQQNHIWSREELQDKLETYKDVHTPVEFSDHVMHAIMYYGLYHPFNFITGYKEINPSPRSIEWRLIILESFAGVPGFVAAGFRHFRSLRLLQKDYGWIGTLLEEAENERMHLLVCMKMFKASWLTRTLALGAQVGLTPFLMAVYMIKPKALHRFVGYLEQTACKTYHNIITHVETPGTELHAAWAHLDAPAIAKGYWHLAPDAKWVDALKCMYADEANHRCATLDALRAVA